MADSSTYKMGNWSPTGKPQADWSRFSAFVAGLFAQTLFDDSTIGSGPEYRPVALDQKFRQQLAEAGSFDQLSEKEQQLVKSLADKAGVDISYWPGGENYRVSLESSANPLGLPGDLWGAVTEPEQGAQVVALVEVGDDGDLNIMVPGGRGWEPLNELDVIEGYTLVGLSPEAEELYKKYDRDNNLGVVSSYPLSPDGPFPTQAQLAVPMSTEPMPRRDEEDEYWENSGEKFDADAPVTASVQLHTADDLPEAIRAAVRDPELRWYIERRIAALGLEASLPWQEG